MPAKVSPSIQSLESWTQAFFPVEQSLFELNENLLCQTVHCSGLPINKNPNAAGCNACDMDIEGRGAAFGRKSSKELRVCNMES